MLKGKSLHVQKQNQKDLQQKGHSEASAVKMALKKAEVAVPMGKPAKTKEVKSNPLGVEKETPPRAQEEQDSLHPHVENLKKDDSKATAKAVAGKTSKQAPGKQFWE